MFRDRREKRRRNKPQKKLYLMWAIHMEHFCYLFETQYFDWKFQASIVTLS